MKYNDCGIIGFTTQSWGNASPDETDNSMEVEKAIEQRAAEIKEDMLAIPAYLIEKLTEAELSDYEELGQVLLDLLNSKRGLFYHARKTVIQLNEVIEKAAYNQAEREIMRNR